MAIGKKVDSKGDKGEWYSFAKHRSGTFQVGYCKSGKSSASNTGIIDANRKTEICRNWEKGSCQYGDSCAFAHGVQDLKFQSLNEMERTGRIPNAAKFRCYPCMTWVATGSCPYQSRCVFIHDPRLRARKDLSRHMLPDISQEKLVDTLGKVSDEITYTSGYGNSGLSPTPGTKDFFFWPEVQRPPSIPPACEATYELSSSMAFANQFGDMTSTAVYHLWYSLIESMLTDKGHTLENAANGKAAVPPLHLPIFQELASGKEVTPSKMPMPKLSSTPKLFKCYDEETRQVCQNTSQRFHNFNDQALQSFLSSQILPQKNGNDDKRIGLKNILDVKDIKQSVYTLAPYY